MGDFDDKIASLKEMKKQYEEDLRDMRSGLWKHTKNGVDITDELIRRTEHNIKTIETHIAGYEAHND
jgi:hypothetical protein